MIQNETEFQELMKEVDAEMVREQTPVAGRQLVAFSKVSKKLAIKIPMGGYGFEPRDPIDGVYTGYDLSLRIQRWFSGLYGDKLKIDFDLGAVGIEIAGEIYKMRLPTVYGSVKVVVDPSGMGVRADDARLNVLDMIVDLTPSLANRLTKKESEEMLALFFLGMDVFVGIKARDNELLSKARSDLKAATFYLLHRPPELGLAKWACLQATEKALKEYIARHGGSYPKGGKGHDLEELAKIAEMQGLPTLDRALVGSVQCQAGVRYEESSFTMRETLGAQSASLKICLHALTH